MERSLMLSTGEFARICHISRELLIHYDRIGLLKPKQVDDNGYRYYSIKQLYLFDAIRFFLDAGMSTKEIKGYLDNRSTELFLASIDGRIESLRKQQQILSARISMMEKMRYLTERSLLFPKGEPRLSFWGEKFLVATEIQGCSQKDYIQALSNHSAFCHEVGFISKFPLGRLVENLDVPETGRVLGQRIITWISTPEDYAVLGDRLLVKPEGNYAVIIHRGGWANIAESYTRLLRYIVDNDLTVCSPAYEFDMNTYLASASEEDYLIHISILVR